MAGLILFRTVKEPPFDAATVQRLLKLRAVLEQAFRLMALRGAQSTATTSARRASVSLTPRERDIARLVTSGASNAVIAAELGIREATVKAHLANIYTKLSVRSRTQLAALMRQAASGRPLAAAALPLSP